MGHEAVAVQCADYFLGGAMVSLATLATRNFTTVLALILMGSPVWGLRPMRALRSALTSLPMPGMVNSPFFLVSFTARSASSSRPAADCLLVISSFSAMVRTSWVLVIPFAIVLLLFVNRVAVWWPVLGRPLSGPAPYRESENREIASVDAGA